MKRYQQSAITIMVCYTLAMCLIIATMRWWFVSATIYIAVGYFLDKYYFSFKFTGSSDLRARLIIWFWWLTIPYMAFQLYDQEETDE